MSPAPPGWREYVLRGGPPPPDRGTARGLDLSFHPLDRGAWARLCALGDAVESLQLAGCELVDGDLARLGWLPALSSLDLSECPITDDGLAALAQLGSLRQLVLARTAVTGRGLASLPATLTSLDLRGAPIDHTEGLRAVAALTDLRVDGRAITDAHLAPLVAHHLERLVLAGTSVTGANLGELRPSLRVLDLAGSCLDDDGAASLPWSRAPLMQLDVSGTQVSDSGLYHLASLHSLGTLALAGTRVTGEGMRHLGRLDRLCQLDLRHTPLDERDLAPLEVLPRLRELDLCDRRIPRAAHRRLKQLLANVGPLRITSCDLAGHRPCVGIDACVVPVLESTEAAAARVVGTGVYVLMPGTIINFLDGRHPVVKSGDLRVLTPGVVAARAAPEARRTALSPTQWATLKPTEPRPRPGETALLEQIASSKLRNFTSEAAGAPRDGTAREVTLWSHVAVTLRADEPVVVIACRLDARGGDEPVGLVRHEATVSDARDDAVRIVLDEPSTDDLLGAGVFATRDGALALAGMVVDVEGATVTVATRPHLEAAAHRS